MKRYSSLISHLSSLQFKQRFTLIELLVVIAIIAILASMLLPSLNSARQKAQIVKCTGILKEIATSALMYSTDNQEYVMPCVLPDKSTGDWRKWYDMGYEVTPSLYTRRVGNKVYHRPPACPLSFREAGLVAWGCSSFAPDKGSPSYNRNEYTGYWSSAPYCPFIKRGKVRYPSKKITMWDGYREHGTPSRWMYLPGDTENLNVAWDRHTGGAGTTSTYTINTVRADGHVEKCGYFNTSESEAGQTKLTLYFKLRE